MAACGRPAAARLDWRTALVSLTFPAEHKDALAKEFMQAINTKRFREMLGKSGAERYESIIAGLKGTVDPKTGQGTVPITEILKMLESVQ